MCSYKCIEIYELDPLHFLSAPWLAWKSCLKNTYKVILELITDYDMLMMVENGISVEFVKEHIGMLKQTINIWIIIIKKVPDLFKDE